MKPESGAGIDPALAGWVLVAMLVCLVYAIWRLLKTPFEQLTSVDRFVGYLLLGRHFAALHARFQAWLSRRRAPSGPGSGPPSGPPGSR